MRLVIVLAAVFVLGSPGMLMGQSSAQRPGVEDIYVVRSLRLSRISPTDFCAERRTGSSAITMEDQYDFKAVATSSSSGVVTSASGPTVGHLHACFGPTSDSLVVSFYAEGSLNHLSLIGRGQCRTTRRDFPEAGITLITCFLDLTSASAVLSTFDGSLF